MKKLKPIDAEKVVNIKDLINKSAERYSNHIAYRERDNAGVFQNITYEELRNNMNNFGTGLFAEVIKAGQKVALLSENSYKWMLTYTAVINGGGIIVPIDPSWTDVEIENVLRTAEIDAIVYSGAQSTKVNNVLAKEDIKTLPISMVTEENNAMSLESISELGKQLIQLGDLSYINYQIDEEAFSILIFTSGTSSESKAVMLSQSNIADNLSYIKTRIKFKPTDVNPNMLPFHHVYGTTMQFMMLEAGAKTIISTGNSTIQTLKNFQNDMINEKSTVINFVPLMLTKYRKTIIRKLEMAGRWDFVKKLMFDKNLSSQEEAMKESIFKEIKDSIFGENIELIICAAAPMDPKDAQFFMALGIDVIEVFGLSEGGPVIGIGDRIHSIPGYVGCVNVPSGPKIKIIDPNENGVGEIIASGKSIMQGYFKNDAATAEALQVDEEGLTWLYTGDLGAIDLVEDPKGIYEPTEMLRWAGRKKNVIVLSSGKKIYPEELEAIIGRIDLVAENLIVQDGNTDGLAALIFLNTQFMKDLEISKSDAELMLKAEIDKINTDLPEYKHIRKIVYREVPFDKTSTNKIKKTERTFSSI